MPIKVTDFIWNQKDSSLFITFELKNCSLRNVDIVCTSSYLKVNFTPYIFELFLCHKIDPELTSSIIKDGKIHFHLIKASNENWKSLEQKLSSKEEAQALRVEALKEYEELEKKKEKEKKEKAVSLERLAVSRQISWNEEKHLKQKELLRQEEQNFFRENTTFEPLSEETRMRLSSLCSEDGSVVVSEGGYDGDVESISFSSSENLPAMLKSSHCAFKESKEKSKVAEKTACPHIRQGSLIKMRHTPHQPSVPKRESLTSCSPKKEVHIKIEGEASETEMIKKEAMRSEAAKSFSCGDYDGALKMYTSLINLDPTQASLYSNRAAAYLAINSYEEAIKDCSKALELLSPTTKENARSRLLCHVRRGTSFVRLKDMNAGLKDFESALRLDPNNVSLAKDAAVIRASLNAYSDDSEDGLECHSALKRETEKEESQSNFSNSPC